jgi:NAD(P)H-nitrite reductase large subunit
MEFVMLGERKENPDSEDLENLDSQDSQDSLEQSEESWEYLCYCNEVTLQKIHQVLEELKSQKVTVALITEKTRAGRSCGQCRKDIQKLLEKNYSS